MNSFVNPIKRRQRFRPSLTGFVNHSSLSGELIRSTIKTIGFEMFTDCYHQIKSNGGAYMVENVLFGYSTFETYDQLMPFYQKHRRLIIGLIKSKDENLVTFILHMPHSRLHDRNEVFKTLYGMPREFNFIVVRAICLWVLQQVAIDWSNYIAKKGALK